MTLKVSTATKTVYGVYSASSPATARLFCCTRKLMRVDGTGNLPIVRSYTVV